MPFAKIPFAGAPRGFARPFALPRFDPAFAAPEDDDAPLQPVTPAVRSACGIVRQLTAEMIALISDRVQLRRDRRRINCYVRQIAMYVCHVALRISLNDIGQAFGRDRTTVGHACGVVEDRRDDPGFDEFVSSVERIAIAIFETGASQ